MADLRTTFMGLDLKNPVIVAASGITGSIEGIKRCAGYGAGAVVLKSMFEEIIVSQAETLNHAIIETAHPEAYNYVQAEIGMQFGSRPYLKFIEETRKAVSIPVIASVNCTSSKWWVPYSKDIETAGAHGIELNISHFPRTNGNTAHEIEKQYADIVHEVTHRIAIPVAVKLGYYFTSLYDVFRDIIDAGALALVLFNRFYAVDIDITKKQFKPMMTFSSPQEMSLPLRWIGIAAGELDCDIAASTGIHDSTGVIKMIMAGADVVQICSALYLHGTRYLQEIIKGTDTWLDENNYQSIAEIRGLAIQATDEKNSLLKRLQYIKALNEASTYKYE